MDAQYCLGSALFYGNGVQEDKAAVGWYRKAAEQGHVGAQHKTGDAY